MKMIFAAAVMAAGLLAVMPQPASAGGHEPWRSCGGIFYEGCDGIPRGPYANYYRGNYQPAGYRHRRHPHYGGGYGNCGYGYRGGCGGGYGYRGYGGGYGGGYYNGGGGYGSQPPGCFWLNPGQIACRRGGYY